MAGGGGQGTNTRELDQTPTWAVATVCAVIILISIILEKALHKVGELFHKKRKAAMVEALEKVKGELMVLGFISLLLTFCQNYILAICIPKRFGDTMLPCPKRGHHFEHGHNPNPGADKEDHHRRLLWFEHRFLAADSPALGCNRGLVPLISAQGLHQLHIFIFFLAVFHVIYSCITMKLGRMKVSSNSLLRFGCINVADRSGFSFLQTRAWKEWEQETASEEYLNINDPARFRLTHETSFVREHISFLNRTPILFYLACFFRQFFRSVRKSDYLTMRHGFIAVHLAPGSKFNFRKYIKRSLEDDFKVVVGISPLLWASGCLFLLLDVSGWHVMFFLSVVPLVIILAVGTKLQAIISKMAIEIKEKHAVVQGIPLVQVSDRHFWFSKPQLILYLIHYTLFQNAFEITYFFWIWYEFGLRSCFHQEFFLVITRVTLGVGVQFLCSYVTLPLYALVTQMGSNLKRSIFDEYTSKALKNWHKKAKKGRNDGKPAPLRTRTLGGTIPDSPSSHSPRNTLKDAGQRTQEVSNMEREPSTPNRTAKIIASVDVTVEQSPPQHNAGWT
ncbi:Mlo-related protein [Dillenia turbinata]|uniref:MLO-like protein n=1 Tax=Dillenia turbinata TaxID=194707 RepID=A0AAN8ZM64_9MAGN